MELKQKADGRTLAALLQNPRYEVIPLSGTEEAVVRHVPQEVKLTVTASVSKGLEATLDLASKLSWRGFWVAPHLPARLVRDRDHLAEIVSRLSKAGIQEAFVIAGDAIEPVGEFEGAEDLLIAMSETGYGFDEIGITGYPESHPFISDEATIRAMNDKAPYATYMVSQICFDADKVSGWVRRVRDRGVGLPLYIGMPGVVSRQKLLRISTSIGLGESARFLGKHRSRMARLIMPGGYNPNALLRNLKPTFADAELNVQGLHIYTFNELEKTEKWRREKLERIGAA